MNFSCPVGKFHNGWINNPGSTSWRNNDSIYIKKASLISRNQVKFMIPNTDNPHIVWLLSEDFGLPHQGTHNLTRRLSRQPPLNLLGSQELAIVPASSELINLAVDGGRNVEELRYLNIARSRPKRSYSQHCHGATAPRGGRLCWTAETLRWLLR